MAKIDAEVLKELALSDIERVTFYKRDEITTDLICCEVEMPGTVRTFHEELGGWDVLLQHLYNLPGFQTDWYAAVSRPAFEATRTVAFSR